jgi:hypothetical protein
MGTPTIFKRDYPFDYVTVNANGRRNRQHSTFIIVKLKKVMECTVVEVEVDVGQINVFGAFSQGSSNPSPPPHCRKRPREHREHEVDDDNDYDDNDYKGGGGGGGGRRGGGGGRGLFSGSCRK